MSVLLEVVRKYQKPESAVDFNLVVKFMQYYGYVSDNYTVSEFEEGLKLFKEIAGIKEEGLEKSFRLMSLPRCGLKDKSLLKENASAVNKWGLKTLTYFVKGRDSDLSIEDWDSALARALKSWSEVCDLTFVKVEK